MCNSNKAAHPTCPTAQTTANPSAPGAGLVGPEHLSPEHLPMSLVQLLRSLPPLVVALSGGIDSRFLCYAAQLCGADVLAVHARGPHIPAGESTWALAWAKACGLPVLVVDFDPLPLPHVINNSRDRCYACKTGLLAAIGAALVQAGQKGRTLCDGSNADDLNAFRPGLRALKEAEVVSPLALAGMDKGAIRAAARATGLDDPEQRARPCLLTRLAYGLEPQKETLARLAAAEEELAALTDVPAAAESISNIQPCPRPVIKISVSALGDLRLRLTPEPVLQVESLPEKHVGKVKEILSRQGFAGCELRVGQGVSGFYDRQQN
ncbi:MAG: PP-loop family protein [Desulfovibrio sp.]|nr:PP-loop family protein [Desulfovibrio sp.]